MTQKQPTISLVMIHRRAGAALGRAVLSALDQVDEVLLVDTGPVDDDEAAGEARRVLRRDISVECDARGLWFKTNEFSGDEFLFDGKRFTADFAAARNFAHDRVTCDWELMIDADDELEPGPDAVPLREIIAQVQKEHLGVGEFSMSYDYGAGVTQDRVRLWRRRHGWRWVGALHEERKPLADGRHTRCQIGPEFWSVRHHGDAKASRERNAALLEYLHERNGWDGFTPQMICAWMATKLDGEIPELALVPNMPRGTSRAALALYHSLRAEAYRRQGWEEKILAELGAAVALAPTDRAMWAELGLEWAARDGRGDASLAHYALEMAYHILPEAEWNYLAPTEWFEGEARQKAEAFFDKQLHADQRAHEIFARRGKDNGPRDFDRIDFVVPSPVSGWGPTSGKVVGGSELAMLEVAPRLERMGLAVHVWASGLLEPQQTTTQGGTLSWHDLDDFDPSEPRGAVVVWRDPRRIAGCQGFGYPVWLWAHDIPEAYGAEGLHLADKVFALSEHHARRFDGLGVEESRIVRSQNGLDHVEIERVQSELTLSGVRREPHRAVYCSSANRGLLLLLDAWPLIRDAVPDATLEVCYGLDLFKHKDTPSRLRGLPSFVLERCKGLAPLGVTFRGAIPHDELLRTLGTAGVWTYPCVFEEIFCIAAIEAQAMGAWPVTTDMAALTETVKNGIVLPYSSFADDVRLTDEERALGEVWTARHLASKKYVAAVVKTMLDPPSEEARVNISHSVLAAYNWGNVAAYFAAALKEVHSASEVEQGVLP